MACATVALLPPAEAAKPGGGTVSWGPCGDPFINEFGQVCWKISCSDKPDKCGPQIFCLPTDPYPGPGEI